MAVVYVDEGRKCGRGWSSGGRWSFGDQTAERELTGSILD